MTAPESTPTWVAAVRAVRDKWWRKSQGDQTIIDDAGVMQAICYDLDAVMEAAQTTPTLLASREALARGLCLSWYDAMTQPKFWDDLQDFERDGFYEQADALLAANVVQTPAAFVASAVVDEYAVRYGDGEVEGVWGEPAEAQQFIASLRRDNAEWGEDPNDYEPMVVVHRKAGYTTPWTLAAALGGAE